MIEKQNTQPIFHFLLSELIVQCSDHSEDTTESRLKRIGRQLGFKLYPQICLKRGIAERPSTIVDVLKNIKSKVFKHLFNYQLSPEVNTYRAEEKKAVFYGITDQAAVYLAWMPQNCQMTACALISGIIEAIVELSDLHCSVSARKPNSEKDAVEYLVEVTLDQVQRWEKK